MTKTQQLIAHLQGVGPVDVSNYGVEGHFGSIVLKLEGFDGFWRETCDSTMVWNFAQGKIVAPGMEPEDFDTEARAEMWLRFADNPTVYTCFYLGGGEWRFEKVGRKFFNFEQAGIEMFTRSREDFHIFPEGVEHRLICLFHPGVGSLYYTDWKDIEDEYDEEFVSALKEKGYFFDEEDAAEYWLKEYQLA